MYISKISITHIRGFSKLEFDLDRGRNTYAGWTVFTGDNGSGKSTLLKAIAIAITGKDTARSFQPSFHRWIRDGAEEASIELEIVRVNTDDDLSVSGKSPPPKFPLKLALENGKTEPTLSVVSPAGKPAKYATPDRTVWSPEGHGWFSCGYGPFRRVFGASPEATRQMVAPATERFVTMFAEAASLGEVNEWMVRLSHKALEHRSQEREQLELLKAILCDELLPNQIVVDRVDSDGLWLKDRNGVQLAWSEMSDGYRSALALMADIIRHLIASYGIGNLIQRGGNGEIYVDRSGVVLIDEVDAHLHPEWQRVIGFWLKRHFPKIQFLVTSHSPIICQAADENGLFVLPSPGSNEIPRALSNEEYEVVIASRPDTILRSGAFGLQNTRSPRAVEGRAELAVLNAKKRAGAKLSKDEEAREIQLQLFATNESEA
jgi:hypothetical protein